MMPMANRTWWRNDGGGGWLKRIGCGGIGCGGVTEFIVLSAEPVGHVMLLEAAHTSDPSLDPAVVLYRGP
jgi:predicted acetyltransferase